MKSKGRKSSTMIAHASIGAIFLAGLAVVACRGDVEQHSDFANAQEGTTDRTGPSPQPTELVVPESGGQPFPNVNGIDVPGVDSEDGQSTEGTRSPEPRPSPFLNTEIPEEFRRDLELDSRSSANPYEFETNPEAAYLLISEADLEELRQNLNPRVPAEFEQKLADGLEAAAAGRIPAEFDRALADGLEAAASGRIPPEFESLLTETPSSSERALEMQREASRSQPPR